MLLFQMQNISVDDPTENFSFQFQNLFLGIRKDNLAKFELYNEAYPGGLRIL